MRATVVIERVIETDEDPSTCSECPWRDGHTCDLFVTELVPVTARLTEVVCRRSSECLQAERKSEHGNGRKSVGRSA